jgi:hypothetical protein
MTLSQPDDNMIPGQTYTFQLKCTNLLTLPSSGTIQSDLQNNAPSFVADLQVTSPTLTSLYNCQFTYSGDGTDVIADVANSLIAAIGQGSSDSFVFVGAVADTAQSITITPGSATQKVVDTVGDAIHNATQGAASDIAGAAQKVLTPIEVLLVIAVGLVALLIFTSGKAGGVNISEFGAKIGGK